MNPDPTPAARHENAVAFANTISESGSHAFLGMNACEKFGSTWGCRPHCPVFMAGKCELQEENAKQFAEDED